MKRKNSRKALPDTPVCDSINRESNSKLPPDVLEGIERALARRKALRLFDDSKERIERAIKYQEFRRGRK